MMDLLCMSFLRNDGRQESMNHLPQVDGNGISNIESKYEVHTKKKVLSLRDF
jgi:hypothetical protein